MSTSRFRDLPFLTRAYVSCVIIVGCLTIGQAFGELFLHSIGWKWTMLALLTLVSGSATVNLPGLPATVSVSETFVFTSVLLFGPAAGTLTVALDALVISFWWYRKGHPSYKIIFNVAAVSLALWIASHLYYAISPYDPLATLPDKTTIRIQEIVLPLL